MALETADFQNVVEGLHKQAELAASRWDRRRSDEWKITLAFWAAVLASSKFLAESSFVVALPIVFAIAGGLILTYFLVFLPGLFASNDRDKKWERYHCEVASLLIRERAGIPRIDEPKFLPEPSSQKARWNPFRTFTDYSHLFKLIVTLIVMGAAVVIATAPKAEQRPALEPRAEVLSKHEQVAEPNKLVQRTANRRR